jgi:hypothetical protein
LEKSRASFGKSEKRSQKINFHKDYIWTQYRFEFQKRWSAGTKIEVTKNIHPNVCFWF